MVEWLGDRRGLDAAPIVVNGMLLVPSWDHKLYAFTP